MIGTTGGRPSKTMQICTVTKDKAAELLNVSPRLVAAVIAAKLANMRQGERTDLQPSANLQNVSQSTAAELLNVARRDCGEVGKYAADRYAKAKSFCKFAER